MTELSQDKRAPLRCRIFGHKWVLPYGFYVLRETYTWHCARKDCTATKEDIFWVERF